MFSGLSRRQLLKLIGALVTGGAAVSSIPLIGKLLVGTAQAQSSASTQQATTYKGRTISVTPNNNDPMYPWDTETPSVTPASVLAYKALGYMYDTES